MNRFSEEGKVEKFNRSKGSKNVSLNSLNFFNPLNNSIVQYKQKATRSMKNEWLFVKCAFSYNLMLTEAVNVLPKFVLQTCWSIFLSKLLLLFLSPTKMVLKNPLRPFALDLSEELFW